MARNIHYSIFKKGSRTYFHSSLFFPPQTKKEVFTLYAFVRQADDLVDSIPQKTEAFARFCDRWERAAKGEVIGDPVIDPFAELARRKSFDTAWIDAFLHSMAMDLRITRYETQNDLGEYLYGSAEVIGLMMARVLNLPITSYPTAQLLGRSMQYINFIRDIAEDCKLGRIYLPQEELRECGLTALTEEEAHRSPEAFRTFIRKQIGHYRSWEAEAEHGFTFLPYRYLIPVKTAAELYQWTAHNIDKNPFVVFERKVRPSVLRILYRIILNSVTIPVHRRRMPWGDLLYET